MSYANLLLNVLYHIVMEMKIRESCLQTGTFIYKPGILVTKQDFHLQSGSLVLQMGFSGYYLPAADVGKLELKQFLPQWSFTVRLELYIPYNPFGMILYSLKIKLEIDVKLLTSILFCYILKVKQIYYIIMLF